MLPISLYGSLIILTHRSLFSLEIQYDLLDIARPISLGNLELLGVIQDHLKAAEVDVFLVAAPLVHSHKNTYGRTNSGDALAGNDIMRCFSMISKPPSTCSTH